MNARKHLLAALVLGASGLAFAQGTPPNTTSPNPATGAGQQSPAGGPMGTTGTMPQNQAAPAAGGSGSMGTTGSTGSTSGSMNSSTNMNTTNNTGMRPARADRN
ncbi:conserved exported hypothetical protein [Burkholderiales bacterium 8X]|nr:conserved exported hypothetical protein [Burkholderiales bacterium 8X]